MPKHTIEFSLPEEQGELNTTLRAGAYHSVLWETLQFLRTTIKHFPDKDSEEKLKAFEEVREFIWREIRERDVDADF